MVRDGHGRAPRIANPGALQDRHKRDRWIAHRIHEAALVAVERDRPAFGPGAFGYPAMALGPFRARHGLPEAKGAIEERVDALTEPRAAMEVVAAPMRAKSRLRIHRPALQPDSTGALVPLAQQQTPGSS